jgi:hypothetical protein
MVSKSVVRSRTASGAVAVQVHTKDRGRVVGVEHIGSAHDDASLELLLLAARERVRPGQGTFDLEGVEAVSARMTDTADWTGKARAGVPVVAGRPRAVAAGGRVVATASLLLWDVLCAAYARIGLDIVGDDAFRAMVLARIIEPTSKADTVRVLGEIGAPSPSLRTLFRALGRARERDYRGLLATAAAGFSARTTGKAALLMYDVTTLHFQIDDEDEWRKVGMSKEHRVDPQIQVGLLVDPAGFPLEIAAFDGNTAETTTLVPVLRQFQARHGVSDLVVVADAGMLSASNLNALEDAGFSFIVGSRLAKAPYDLADHFEAHGTVFADGQILESSRVMGTGSAARLRRIVYQWSFKRNKRDDVNINKMIARAERIAQGGAPLKKARFLKIAAATKGLDQHAIDRARRLAGVKGYVTSLPKDVVSGATVISAYHDLFKVEASFRMVKSDLRARPVFHHERDAIEAHLTVVFAALAVARHLQEHTGMSIKKLVKTLRPIRSATIEINGQRITIDPAIPTDLQPLLDKLTEKGH